MKRLSPKVSIIGCGNVGMRYAYSMIIKGIARELVLVDYNKKKAEGEAMDLSHGAPYVSPVNVYAGDYSDTTDSNLVVITAGRGQKPGETRIDLVKGNAEILKSIVPQLVKYSPKAIILVASNPVDILSYITYKISGKSSNEVIGSGTVLDSARFRYLIGKHCNVDSRSIHASILGEHGDTEFPMWSKAMIGGILFSHYCDVCKNQCRENQKNKLEKIFTDVRDSAYEIIEKKGETSYGIGLALTKISKAVLKDENTVLPVSSLLENYHGISDIYLSVPAVVHRTGIRQTLEVDFNEEELQAFLHSARQVKKIIKKSGF
ncbi:MAG: L-lactate dehydrogenase [Endomicrobium sp.]|jgi:L-lactate dehydrogenase|nr:L-lactate dehydrogenase [Endomicrobium sp.]